MALGDSFTETPLQGRQGSRTGARSAATCVLGAYLHARRQAGGTDGSWLPARPPAGTRQLCLAETERQKPGKK